VPDPPKQTTNKRVTKQAAKAEDVKPSNSDEKGTYFWNNQLHQEFMRHFVIYGKTWKVVSQMMTENGIKDKDQLQCRTHGQKYLLSLEEIKKTIEKSGITKDFDKKIYVKMTRYEDDKKFLYKLYLKDQAQGYQSNLLFQSEHGEEMFRRSIPPFIEREVSQGQRDQVSEGSTCYETKTREINQAIRNEL